ncbi:hypothetical protein JZ751_009108 [Albula glossodonta]|uniref:Uncharacterized protein n=1 Tax=Albula glossodonta TaxID=121402 RepID=A0A8T2N8N6_9TELE|nr:hypothetical protein JZ751_009108 [Albula glossodonta]
MPHPHAQKPRPLWSFLSIPSCTQRDSCLLLTPLDKWATPTRIHPIAFAILPSSPQTETLTGIRWWSTNQAIVQLHCTGISDAQCIFTRLEMLHCTRISQRQAYLSQRRRLAALFWDQPVVVYLEQTGQAELYRDQCSTVPVASPPPLGPSDYVLGCEGLVPTDRLVEEGRGAAVSPSTALRGRATPHGFSGLRREFKSPPPPPPPPPKAPARIVPRMEQGGPLEHSSVSLDQLLGFETAAFSRAIPQEAN